MFNWKSELPQINRKLNSLTFSNRTNGSKLSKPQPNLNTVGFYTKNYFITTPTTDHHPHHHRNSMSKLLKLMNIIDKPNLINKGRPP